MRNREELFCRNGIDKGLWSVDNEGTLIRGCIMKYLYCQADGCGTYVDGMNCSCGWKQAEECECSEGFTEIPTELLKRVVENWQDSTYYCEAIAELKGYLE